MKLIFTDLDGTLLDHHTYSFKEADEALTLAKESNTPVIINTSKTKEEVLSLREELENRDPFIVENGAGIFFPNSFEDSSLEDYGDYRALVIGEKIEKILNEVQSLKEQYGFRGFSDFSVEEVVKYTGLDPISAEKAKKRDFTEPFVLENPEIIEEIMKRVDDSLQITQGGRFFHFISKNQDKGRALIKTKELYEKIYNEKIETIALGDGKNDYSMLAVADYPVLIPKPDGEHENQSIKNHIKAPFPGPKGWNAVIKDLLGE